jgi:hypothetical protein
MGRTDYFLCTPKAYDTLARGNTPGKRVPYFPCPERVAIFMSYWREIWCDYWTLSGWVFFVGYLSPGCYPGLKYRTPSA